MQDIDPLHENVSVFEDIARLGIQYLVGIFGVNIDLLVLLKPSVHYAELDLDEAVELFHIIVDGCRSFSALVPYDDVVQMVLLRLEGIYEILLWYVRRLEEIVGVIWFEPST